MPTRWPTTSTRSPSCSSPSPRALFATDVAEELKPVKSFGGGRGQSRKRGEKTKGKKSTSTIATNSLCILTSLAGWRLPHRKPFITAHHSSYFQPSSPHGTHKLLKLCSAPKNALACGLLPFFHLREKRSVPPTGPLPRTGWKPLLHPVLFLVREVSSSKERRRVSREHECQGRCLPTLSPPSAGALPEKREQHTLSVKGWRGNILGLASHTVSVTTTQLCCGSTNADMNRMGMARSNKTLFTKSEGEWIWPMGCHWPAVKCSNYSSSWELSVKDNIQGCDLKVKLL